MESQSNTRSSYQHQFIYDEINPLAWEDKAVCATSQDPDIFFPEKGKQPTEAKKICDTCPVINQCLEFALVNNETSGVWGGYSASERRIIKRRGYVAINR